MELKIISLQNKYVLIASNLATGCSRCEQDGKLIRCDSLHFQLQEGQCQLRYYTSQNQSVRFLGVFEPNSQKKEN
jgi:hypothetical protein